MALIYTVSGAHAPVKCENSQCMAFSSDGGHSFKKSAMNPVISQITRENRDPHVFWHNKTRRWVMTLYLDKLNAVMHEFAILTSSDLMRWTESDRVRMPSFECPGLCELKAADSSDEHKWIFLGAEGCYLVGDFNGEKFTPTQGALWDGTTVVDEHGSAYAGQAFSNVPDGRCVKISWMCGGELPGMPFNQFMTLPLEFFLVKSDCG